ncbi:MAG: PilZ domain-containing protein [Acidobacteria bacterium]|nr:PilZ domain-containing protein [Acidobacteriota bacterium]
MEKERRRHERFSPSESLEKTFLWRVTPEGYQRLEIMNISLEGFLVKSTRPLQVDQELSLIFDVPQTSRVFPITAKVRHIRSGAYGIEILDFGVSSQEYQTLVEAWFCLHSLD